MARARRLRFDELDLAPAVVAIVGGVLLMLLGHAIRAVDEHLADFDQEED